LLLILLLLLGLTRPREGGGYTPMLVIARFHLGSDLWGLLGERDGL